MNDQERDLLVLGVQLGLLSTALAEQLQAERVIDPSGPPVGRRLAMLAESGAFSYEALQQLHAAWTAQQNEASAQVAPAAPAQVSPAAPYAHPGTGAMPPGAAPVVPAAVPVDEDSDFAAYDASESGGEGELAGAAADVTPTRAAPAPRQGPPASRRLAEPARPSRRLRDGPKAEPRGGSGPSGVVIGVGVAAIVVIAIGLAAVVFSGEDPGVVRARKAAAIRKDIDAGRWAEAEAGLTRWRETGPGVPGDKLSGQLDSAIDAALAGARRSVRDHLRAERLDMARAALGPALEKLPKRDAVAAARAELERDITACEPVIAALEAGKGGDWVKAAKALAELDDGGSAVAGELLEHARGTLALQGEAPLKEAAAKAGAGDLAGFEAALERARIILGAEAPEIARVERTGRRTLAISQLLARVGAVRTTPKVETETLTALRGDLTAQDCPLDSSRRDEALELVDQRLRAPALAKIEDLSSAGEHAAAKAALAELQRRPWRLDSAAHIELEARLVAAGQDAREQALTTARRDFKDRREQLAKAWQQRDWSALQKLLEAPAPAPELARSLELERHRLKAVLALRESALKGFKGLIDSSVDLARRSRGKVKGRLLKVKDQPAGLELALGGGRFVIALDELARDEIVAAAIRGSKDRKLTRVRGAILALGDGDKAAAQSVLEAHPGVGEAEALLAEFFDRPKGLADAGGAKTGKGPGESDKPAGPGTTDEPRPADGTPGRRPPPAAGGGGSAGDGFETPDTAEPEMVSALVAYREGHLARCLAKVKAFLKRKEGSALGWLLYGWLEFDYGRYDSSLEKLTKAVKLDAEFEAEKIAIEAKIHFIRAEDEAANKLRAKLTPDSPTNKILPRLTKPEGMSSLKSKEGHYIVYVDEELKRRKGDVYAARLLELIHAAYSKVFPFKTDPTVVHRCYIFSREYPYLEFCAGIGMDGRGAAGFFANETRILIINADPRGDKTNRQGFTADAVDTIFHEGFHQFIHNSVPDMPLWFNEGLAEYFGPSILVDARKLRVGTFVREGKVYASRFETIRQAINGETLAPLPLRIFMRQSSREFMQGGTRTSINYAQAWSLMHFLLHDPRVARQGRKVIRSYFKLLKGGATKDDAFRETFGKLNLDQLDKLWREYVLKL